MHHLDLFWKFILIIQQTSKFFTSILWAGDIDIVSCWVGRLNMLRDRNARVCIIGAGPAGITAGKNLLQVGIHNFVIYEKGSAVGGNWIFAPQLSHSSVFETTHIISSKKLSQYEDYPMAADYPDYPSHKQL